MKRECLTGADTPGPSPFARAAQDYDGFVKHFLLFYDVAADYLARRPEFRDAHLERAWAAAARGELLLAGAVGTPPDSAALLFRARSKDVVEAFAKADPYVLNGLVTRWRVAEWTTVAGDRAATPVRPDSTPAGGPVIRTWRGRTTATNAEAYLSHLQATVLPSLRSLDGFLGATVLRRAKDDEMEFLVMTRWASLTALEPFTGSDREAAVVDQAAKAVLSAFDERVEHFDVVLEGTNY